MHKSTRAPQAAFRCTVPLHVRGIIVDGSPGIRALLRRILGELGWTVLEAGGAAEALEILAREPPVDLALVDWRTPGMDGYQLVCRLREDPANDAMRIVMVTAETDVFRIMRVLDAGASEYLMKPFTRQRLLEKLAVLGLRGRSRRDDGRYESLPPP